MKTLSLLFAISAAITPVVSSATVAERQLLPDHSGRIWDLTTDAHVRDTDAPSATNELIKAPDASQPSLVWGWCEEAYMDGPFPSGWYCNSVIGFPASLTHKFNGCQVTSVIICKGYYEETPLIDIFMAKGNEVPNEWGSITLYTEEPFVEMKNTPFPGEEWEWVEFELPEPYLIEADSPFYVGWGYLNDNDNNRPLVSDMVANDNLATSWMEGFDPAEPYYGYWNNCSTAGANCIRLRIAGDNLPSDDIVINGIDAPRMMRLGEETAITLSVSNAASAEVSELEIRYAFAGAESNTITIDGLSIAAGEKDSVTIENINSPIAGNVMLDVEILTVNGRQDSDYTNNMISASILCLPEDAGYERNVVVEEGTGTWCGNCPRGMVGMREMAAKYPEKFIGIAAHSSDPMAIEAYQPYLNRYIDVVGYPYCTVDRAISGDPEFNELEENFLREASVPALAELTIDELSVTGTMVYVKPSVKFAVSENNTEYGWAYVITEDNVGPYPQTNYYTNGTLPGWDYTESIVMTYYDEVACAANSILGVNAIPAITEAEEVYSLPMTFDASNVKDWNKVHIIVMIINMKTGYIENAVRKSFASVGVNTTNASEENLLNVKDSTITLVAGTKTEIYTVSGVKIGNLNSGECIKVPAGIYLAKTGNRTQKLLVR